MTQLGRGMQRTPDDALASMAPLMKTLRDAIAADIETTLGSRLADLETRLSTFAGIAAPVVQVAAPTVQVAAPNVTVEANDTADPTDLTPLVACINGLRADMQTLCQTLARPITRTVRRNPDGTILSITETR